MLIKGGRVIDPSSGTDRVTDIYIKNGEIELIGDGGDLTDDEVIDATGLIVAPGLVDVHVHFRDPGQTGKETLHTGAKAAAAGGYTSVVCMANTLPAVDTADTLRDILDRASEERIHIYQTAALTVGREGRELVDMEELHRKGAAGFTDDGTPVMDEKLVREAMKRAASLRAVLSFHEEDPEYVRDAGVNAGPAARALGLEGAHREAEIRMIERDLEMTLAAGATVDIQHVSAKESVDIIRRYKERDTAGLIHAEATPHHFSLTEEAVERTGTLAKVNPPLRTEEDRLAVAKGVADGTLDIIATDHAPHMKEEKDRSFKQAPSGMVGLETALSLGITNLVDTGIISYHTLIERMSTAPALLYGIPAGSLLPGRPADMVIFDPDHRYILKEKDLHSKSKNSPFIGSELKGRVRYTIAGGRLVYSL